MPIYIYNLNACTSQIFSLYTGILRKTPCFLEVFLLNSRDDGRNHLPTVKVCVWECRWCVEITQWRCSVACLTFSTESIEITIIASRSLAPSPVPGWNVGWAGRNGYAHHFPQDRLPWRALGPRY